MLQTKLSGAPKTSRNVVTYAQADSQNRRKQRLAFQGQRPANIDRGVTSSAASLAAMPASVAAQDLSNIQPHRALQVFSRYRALVLDSAYRPIDVVNWQRAICMDLLDKVDVLEYYDATISSPRAEFFLPAVMRARRCGNKGLRVALNRRNILVRDQLSCQYCGIHGKAVQLTLDHVIPQCKGGGNTWENLVTACAPCNTKKGAKTLQQLKWKLRKEPKEPSAWEMDLVMASIGAGDLQNMPEEWANYLFYGKKGEERKALQSKIIDSSV